MSGGNVLPLFDPPRKMSYRTAVSKVVRDLKSRECLTNVALAYLLDCSDETISNAENEHTDLNAVTLLRIAYVFGEDAIAPVRELYLCRHAEPETLSDKLDSLQAQMDLIRKELAA